MAALLAFFFSTSYTEWHICIRFLHVLVVVQGYGFNLYTACTEQRAMDSILILYVLSKGLWILPIYCMYWAKGYGFYSYTVCTEQRAMDSILILSKGLWILFLCWAKGYGFYSYAEQRAMDSILIRHVLSKGLWILSIYWAKGYGFYPYTEQRNSLPHSQNKIA